MSTTKSSYKLSEPIVIVFSGFTIGYKGVWSSLIDPTGHQAEVTQTVFTIDKDPYRRNITLSPGSPYGTWKFSYYIIDTKLTYSVTVSVTANVP